MKQIDKRQQLVENALALFYAKGIHAVGINEVLAQSGVAKKTLYNHFASKEALIQACIIERDQRFITWFTQRCHDNSSLAVFVEHLFNALDDWINDRAIELGEFKGCFFVNTAAEYGEHTSEIKQLCMQHKIHIKKLFEKKLQPLIKDKVQRDSLTALLMLLKEGCINCAHVMGDKQAAITAKPLATAFIDKI
ncbi:TetR/AcrR family transcriptional regulator [Colwellia sp. E2M01]|uniref:TetR/AcrR family transcriptional regulator n=1 Tax=Colwellia sp. E2M01 TaxID=2841561 RepID=UPI001C0859CD|nr:TetR/AcrR family transcriptional regulator [Colwellia sp. E2M01]MBU2869870.1 TetR/AcrR family transcriptional regulator [Colwellia sp. E2M01]